MKLIWLIMMGLNAPEETLTETKVIQAVQTHPDLAVRTEALTQLGNEQIAVEQAWQNPELIYSQERVNEGSGSSAEAYFLLAWEWDRLGQRNRLKRAAMAEKAGVLAREAWIRADMVHEARLRFHRLLYLQERRAVLTVWLRELNQLRDRILILEQSGQAAKWDVTRVELEREEAFRLLHESQRQARTVWPLLRIWLTSGDEDPPPLAGNLLPAAPEGKFSAGEHPGLNALAHEKEAAELRATAYGRSWQHLTFSAGLKRVEALGVGDSGFFAQVGIPLPFSNPSRLRRARARAEAVQTQTERSLTKRRLETLHNQRYQDLRWLLDEVERFRQRQDQGQTLQDMAFQAYEGGEASVSEVLTALAKHKDLHLATWELVWQARRTWLELRNLEGRHD